MQLRVPKEGAGSRLEWNNKYEKLIVRGPQNEGADWISSYY